MMKVLEIIDLLEGTIESSPNMPLTNKSLMEKEYLLDIVHEIKLKIPEEFKKAKWIEEERQKIFNEARKEADEIIKNAELKAEQMIAENEIVKQASAFADELISTAKKRRREINLTTQKYVDQLLQEAEDILEESISVIKQNKMSIYGNKEASSETKAPSAMNDEV